MILWLDKSNVKHGHACHGRLAKPPELDLLQTFKTATKRRVPLERNVRPTGMGIPDQQLKKHQAYGYTLCGTPKPPRNNYDQLQMGQPQQHTEP